MTTHRDDMLAAVTRGVREGIADMLNNEQQADRLFAAITQGVYEGVRQTATNPSHHSDSINFYAAITRGVTNAMDQVRRRTTQ